MKLTALSTLLLSSLALAATKSYQVTGPLLDVRPDAIVVQKGKDKWEIARTPDQGGDLKVGQKVTVDYTMTAKSIQSKASPDSSKTSKKKK